MEFQQQFTELLVQYNKRKRNEELRRRFLRRTYFINSIPDKEFIFKFRLSRELFENLCVQLAPLLPPKKGQYGMDPSMKILVVLNFFAWGSVQSSIAKAFDMIKSHKLSRCITEVTSALNHCSIVQRYMKFPQTLEERDAMRKQFFKKCGFPNVLGCIDCTHVAITKPAADEKEYLNRNKFYSIHTQIICDYDHNILNVDASFGGANDHTRIWNTHPINDQVSALDETAYIIGTGDYELDDHLLTSIPIVKQNTPEFNYNKIHHATLSHAEQTIYDRLKLRWRCLQTSKPLQYDHGMAEKIIIACCLLHNMCNNAGLPVPKMWPSDVNEVRERRDETMNCLAGCDDERTKVVQQLEEIRLRKLQDEENRLRNIQNEENRLENVQNEGSSKLRDILSRKK